MYALKMGGYGCMYAAERESALMLMNGLYIVKVVVVEATANNLVPVLLPLRSADDCAGCRDEGA